MQRAEMLLIDGELVMSLRSIGLLALLAGCAGPGQLEPPAAVVFKIVDGDDQEGPVKAYAATALTVQAEDAAGTPLAGLPNAWDKPVNGRVIPLSPTTSPQGRAEALFLFGDVAGPAQVSA